MGATDIRQLLPQDDIDAILGANTPDSSNVFATMNDLASIGITELDPVISQINTPPGGPTLGDRYLIDTVPTGAWVGNANSVAEWDGLAWDYTIPVLDNVVYITNTLTTKRFNGSAWVPYAGTALLNNGNNVTSPMSMGSRTNQLVYIKVNNTNIFRFGNASNSCVNPLRLGGAVTTAPDTSAQLEVTSTTKGFLPPRMTKVQREAIGSPATGLLVEQTDGFIGYYRYNGTEWRLLIDSPPYLSCHFTLTQDLTNDPVATILGNNTGSTLTFAYSDVGEYSLTLSVGAATAPKFVLIPSTFTTTGTFDFISFSGTYGVLRSYNSGGAQANSIFSNQFFELRIYL